MNDCKLRPFEIGILAILLPIILSYGCQDQPRISIRGAVSKLRDTKGINVITNYDSDGSFPEVNNNPTQISNPTNDCIVQITIESPCDATLQTHSNWFSSIDSVKIVILYISDPSDFDHFLELIQSIKDVETLLIGFEPTSLYGFDFGLVKEVSGLKNLTVTNLPQGIQPIPNLQSIETLTLARGIVEDTWLQQSLKNNPRIHYVKLFNLQISKTTEEMLEHEFPEVTVIVQERPLSDD